MAWHGMVCMYVYYITVDYHEISKDLPSIFQDPNNYRMNLYVFGTLQIVLDSTASQSQFLQAAATAKEVGKASVWVLS